MARERETTVETPADVIQRLSLRLEQLEIRERQREEAARNPRAEVLTDVDERRRADVGRPASVRTQEAADRKFPAAPGDSRYRVSLDSRQPDGKPGPDVREHFPLEVNARGEHEATARYLDLMGIRKHDYQVVAEPVA